MAEKKEPTFEARVTPLRMQVLKFTIEGITPYVQGAMTKDAIDGIRHDQEQGASSKTKKKRQPKDFAKLCRDSTHTSIEGWPGIPCGAIRGAMVSACRTTQLKMTVTKLAFQVLPDGYEDHSRMALVKITKGNPVMHVGRGTNATGGIDIRSRPLWEPGWQAVVRIEFDQDMLSGEDVVNLLNRAGQQVGIGCGRPDSRDSHGCGWGLFRIAA